MKITKIVAVCFIVALIAVGVVYKALPKNHTVVIDRETIQKKVAARFPIKKGRVLVKIEVKDPEVILEEGSDRIGISLSASVILPKLSMEDIPGNKDYRVAGTLRLTQGTPVTGSITASAMIDYRPGNGSFYAALPVIDELVIDGLPDNIRDYVKKAAQELLSDALQKTPLYILKDDNWKHRAAKLLIRSVKVKNGKFVVKLGLK